VSNVATRILIRTYKFRITNKNSSPIRQFGFPEPLIPICGNLELRGTQFEKHRSICPEIQKCWPNLIEELGAITFPIIVSAVPVDALHIEQAAPRLLLLLYNAI
jgi:hypothetical protein